MRLPRVSHAKDKKQQREIPMDATLTTATWFWLLVPMPLVVLFSLISWLRHATQKSEG